MNGTKMVVLVSWEISMLLYCTALYLGGFAIKVDKLPWSGKANRYGPVSISMTVSLDETESFVTFREARTGKRHTEVLKCEKGEETLCAGGCKGEETVEAKND